MDNRIISEYLKRGNKVFSEEKTLYHYTSTDVFRKILENREFWISNANFMNDEQEILNGISLCREVIEYKRKTAERKYGQFYRSLAASCERRESAGLFNIHSENIFAMSFCSSGDILTQWQEYANGGISIGFRNAPEGSPEKIHLTNTLGTISEMKTISVIYDIDEKKKVMSDLMDIGIEIMEQNPGKNIRDIVVDMVSDALYLFFPAMKNRSFVHERESRFVYYIQDTEDRQVEFREKHGIILPYIRMKITDAEGKLHASFPIDDIVISPGPRIDYVAKSVKYFLKMSGYGYLADKVRKSDIPYRV